ncbi:MAG TPA: MOSC domain-containing protein [Candidatus Aquilonibacter sp.]|nr:MOSC domain-containing protein [Candidatus Aquilonibacter sp.]
MTSQIGVVAAIHRYPVKSMMGEELNAARVGAKGVHGDRVFALADRTTGKIASAKNPSKWPALFSYRAAFTEPFDNGTFPPARITFPDGSTILSGDKGIDEKLSSSLGKPVRFLAGAPGAGTLEEYWPDIDGLARRDVVTDEAMPAETFFDCAAIHLLTTATLDSLRGFYSEGRFESRRFRPNLVIETPPGVKGFPENNDWNEKVLSIGSEVKLKITGPCGRCVMTTLSQGDLPKDTGVLKTAVKHNEARVGAYAAVLQGGFIRAGDSVQIEPA